MPSPPLMLLCAAGVGLATLLYYFLSAREERGIQRMGYMAAPGGGQGQGRRESKYEVEECSICQDIVYNPSSMRILACGHHFHHVCIEKWLEASPLTSTCPNCRQAVR